MDTQKQDKQEWVSPRLEYRGDVGTVLQGGGGKLSIRAGDPGESRCQRGGDKCHHH
jgi:hypothetical protein